MKNGAEWTARWCELYDEAQFSICILIMDQVPTAIIKHHTTILKLDMLTADDKKSWFQKFHSFSQPNNTAPNDKAQCM